jgi:hypothetical protein
MASTETFIALVLAAVAVLTYGSKVNEGRRDLARFVHTLEARVSEDHRILDAVLANDGPAPIRFVGVTLFRPGRRRWWWRVRRGRTGWWTGDKVSRRFFPIVWPETRIDDENMQFVGRFDGSGLGFHPIVVEFTDGNGRRWVRWPDGRLSRQLRPFRDPNRSRWRQVEPTDQL